MDTMDTIDIELITLDSLSKLPTGKLHPLSETELTPAAGRVFVYRGDHEIGGRPWVMRMHEPERIEQ